MVQCQNIVNKLNEHEMLAKLGNIKVLTNDHGKSETESNIIEEMTQVDINEIYINEGTSQLVISEKMNQMVETNQNKILRQIVTQTEIEIEPNPGNLRKVEIPHYTNYLHM